MIKSWQNEMFSNCLDLALRDSGFATVDKHWGMVNITSTFNRLYLPVDGEIFWRDDGEELVMRPGSAYLLPAGFTFSCQCITPTVTKLFFHFNLFKPDHYDLFHDLKKVVHVPFPSECLAEMLACYNGNRYQDGATIQMYLYQIIRNIQKKYDLGLDEVPSYSEHVQDTLDYIHNNLSAALVVEDLARRRFISKSLLTRLFVKEIGVSPGRYIDEQLLLAAQGRLEQTDTSIAGIARELGFNDQFYFSRRFKQLCGITPFGYRRSSKAREYR